MQQIHFEKEIAFCSKECDMEMHWKALEWTNDQQEWCIKTPQSNQGEWRGMFIVVESPHRITGSAIHLVDMVTPSIRSTTRLLSLTPYARQELGHFHFPIQHLSSFLSDAQLLSWIEVPCVVHYCVPCRLALSASLPGSSVPPSTNNMDTIFSQASAD